MVLTPEAVSSTREGSPEALRRRLSGDLDNIVRKAMRKEPDRRYSSTEELAQDIERHLKRMPVLARPDTFRYRAGKFVRRHTVAVAASGLALLSLVAGILATAHQARMARMERARAEQVSAFLTDLFEVSDPSEARGSRVTAREILDQGAARIDRELQGQPQARAALSDTIGTAYLRLGLLDRATPHLERALEIRRRLLGRHPDVALSLEHVAELRAWKGDYAAAERLHREGLALRRETLGPDDPQVAESASLLAGVLYERGDARGAEVLAREALLLRRRSYGENHQLVAETLHNLAKALYAQGDYDGAEALFREALAISRQASEDDPETATNLVSRAAVLNQKGEYDAAETLLKEALSLQRRVLGEDHPDVAAALHALGLSLLRRGALEEAGAALRRSLDLRRKLQGEDHPEAARVSGTSLRKAKSSARTIPGCWTSASPRGCTCTRRGTTTRPRRSSARRSRGDSSGSEASTRTWPGISTVWPPSSSPGEATPRPSSSCAAPSLSRSGTSVAGTPTSD
jgi:serine/threonine-protein kinase